MDATYQRGVLAAWEAERGRPLRLDAYGLPGEGSGYLSPFTMWFLESLALPDSLDSFQLRN
jgi:hypothetical protein